MTEKYHVPEEELRRYGLGGRTSAVLTASEAAEALQVSTSVMRQMVRAKEIAGYKDRYGWRIYVDSIYSYLSRLDPRNAASQDL